MKKSVYLFIIVFVLVSVFVSCSIKSNDSVPNKHGSDEFIYEPTDFTPDEQFFIELIRKYDTDTNLAQYRFRDTEEKPDISKANSSYDFEYEIVNVQSIDNTRYQIDVIRRFPDDPSFFTPIYISFVLDIKDKDNYEYISVMNYVNGEKMQIEDVMLNAVKCYDTPLVNTDYTVKFDSELYLKYLSYAALDLMHNTYSSTEYSSYFDYKNNSITVPSELAEGIIFERFGVLLDRNSISQFDPDKNAYVMPLVIYENFYSLDIVDYMCVKDNVYEVNVERKHQLVGDDSETSRIKFVIEINGDKYRYLSVKHN